MQTGALDFVQSSPAKAGGVSELCKVYSIAAVHNVAVMMSLSCLTVFAMARACWRRSTPRQPPSTAETMIEWCVFDLEAQLYAGALAPKGCRISVPQRPGLGIEPDLGVIRRFLMSQ
jgi:L-alanine-DL-glutamate epimerase-like enolase superfamily enzyme